MSGDQTELYRQLLPTAARFEARAIPPALVAAADRGNDSYVVARDANGEVVGTLRDLIAPVIPGRTTDADQLDLTLVFDPRLRLVDLHPRRPLLKSGGQPLTDDERRELTRLVDDPPAELLATARPDDTVDGVTGATVDALRPRVVAGAAYTSRRLAGVVRDTRALIERAPLVWDQQRLQALLEPPASDAALALGLAALLPTLTTLEARRGALQMMAHAYAQALATAAPPAPQVEAALLSALADDPERGAELARACYQLARRELGGNTVAACLRQVDAAPPAEPAARARLAGTVLAQRGELGAALPELRKAAAVFDLDRDPELHLRLAGSLAASGLRREACATAKLLFRRHPLLRGAEAALAACDRDVAALVDALRAENRAALLARRQTRELAVPSLSLEDARLQTVEWAPTPGVVTVLVAFSTWCPHCKSELPRVNDFFRAAQQRRAWSGRVAVLGLRTAVERERLPYDTFLALTRPEFPILTDSAWSLAFTQLTRTLGLRAELPTVLVIDQAGVVRFVLEAGDYRDTARELDWAVSDLLAGPAADNRRER